MTEPTRTCFVIMPFGNSASCTEAQWTDIFENTFKSAIEGAGLGYKCRRSTANRGNVIKQIINDLDQADVVLADLTDNNPNVFYELGVRHALKHKTILVAQDRGGILKKCVNSQAVYPLSEQHGLKARERRYTAHEEGKHWE